MYCFITTATVPVAFHWSQTGDSPRPFGSIWLRAPRHSAAAITSRIRHNGNCPWLDTLLPHRSHPAGGVYCSQLSSVRPVLFGVPQGSVLGPLLCTPPSFAISSHVTVSTPTTAKSISAVPARYRKSPGLGLGLGLVCRSRLQFKRKRLFVSSPVHPGPLW